MKEVRLNERHMGVLRVLAQGDASTSDLRKATAGTGIYIPSVIQDINKKMGEKRIVNTTAVPNEAVYRLADGKLDVSANVTEKPSEPQHSDNGHRTRAFRRFSITDGKTERKKPAPSQKTGKDMDSLNATALPVPAPLETHVLPDDYLNSLPPTERGKVHLLTQTSSLSPYIPEDSHEAAVFETMIHVEAHPPGKKIIRVRGGFAILTLHRSI